MVDADLVAVSGDAGVDIRQLEAEIGIGEAAARHRRGAFGLGFRRTSAQPRMEEQIAGDAPSGCGDEAVRDGDVELAVDRDVHRAGRGKRRASGDVQARDAPGARIEVERASSIAEAPGARDVDRRQSGAAQLRRDETADLHAPIAGGRLRRARKRELAVETAREAEPGARELGDGKRNGARRRLQREPLPRLAGEGELAAIDRKGEARDIDALAGERQRGGRGKRETMPTALRRQARELDTIGRRRDEPRARVDREASRRAGEGHVARLRRPLRLEAQARERLAAGLHLGDHGLPGERRASAKIARGEIGVDALDAGARESELARTRDEVRVLGTVHRIERRLDGDIAHEPRQHQGREIVEIGGLEGKLALGEALSVDAGISLKRDRAERESEAVDEPAIIARPREMRPAVERLAVDLARELHLGDERSG